MVLSRGDTSVLALHLTAQHTAALFPPRIVATDSLPPPQLSVSCARSIYVLPSIRAISTRTATSSSLMTVIFSREYIFVYLPRLSYRPKLNNHRKTTTTILDHHHHSAIRQRESVRIRRHTLSPSLSLSLSLTLCDSPPSPSRQWMSTR